MGLHKKYSVVESHNGEVLEEFGSIEAAEKFMILMQSKGIQVTVKTDEDDVQDTPDEYNIEGLEIEEPSVEFGSDLDEFNDDAELFDTDQSENEIEFD